MAAPTICTYDLTPPRRPTLDDVGGGAKEDDQACAPNPVTDPTAAEDNQKQNLIVRLATVSPLALVSVHYSGSTPSIAQVASALSAVISTSFTVTNNGTGDVSLTWTAGTFPAQAADPEASVTGATPGAATVESITNGVRVRVRNFANPPAAANLNFNVQIY